MLRQALSSCIVSLPCPAVGAAVPGRVAPLNHRPGRSFVPFRCALALLLRAAAGSKASPTLRSESSCQAALPSTGIRMEAGPPRPPPLTFDPSRRQVFVVGNEAADVDSLVSAYAIAALMDSSETQAIAVAQIPREEFRLRGDALQLFREAGSETLPDGSPTKLNFWDEIDWQAVGSLESRKVVLTDHNRMTSQSAQLFEGRVEWVLDHHSRTGAHPEARSEIDEALGSACSLVTEQWTARDAAGVPKELRVLLSGVILLDTRNFDAGENKGTPRDRAALDSLATVPEQAQQDSWYKQLLAARKDVSHLSVREQMLLDTKVVELGGLRVAFASVMVSLQDILAQAGSPAAVVAAAQDLARARGWKAVVVLFSKDEVTGKRALAPVPLEEALCPCQELVKALKATPGNLPADLLANPLYQSQGLVETGFQLEPIKDLEPLEAYDIKGTVSRKTLLPMTDLVSKC